MTFLTIDSSFPRAAPAGVQGEYQENMVPLVEAFVDNFAKHNELGASLYVSIEGKTVVDLWGGKTSANGAQWGRDTICVIFSCTKAATALCLHVLAARGLVDLDASVARYWPEFAASGKQGITLRMLLDHTAGLPTIREPLKVDCLTDWDYMVAHLEAEAPFWEPGSRTGYHALTFGFLVGEVVRRVSGKSLGQFFQEEIAIPLGLDFAIGLPEQDEPRVAEIEPFRAPKGTPETAFVAAAKERGTIANLFLFNSGDWAYRGVNTRAGRAAEIGAANGVSNARGLGKMFAALAEGGAQLGLSRAQVDAFAQASSATHLDATLLAPTRFGPGFMSNMRARPTGDESESLTFGERAFGHVGMGGSLGFADPDLKMGVSYVMNRHGGGMLLNTRGQSLVDTLYQTLGYSDKSAGYWARGS